MRNSIAILLTALTAMSALGSGRILCIGRDGHVSLESPAKKACCSHDTGREHNSEGSHSKEAAASATDEPCHSCIDIPMPELNITEAESHQASGCPALNNSASLLRSTVVVDSSVDFIKLSFEAWRPFESLPDTAIVLRI